MTKPVAIFSTLWPAFQGSIDPLLEKKPGIAVLTLASHATQELLSTCEKYGSPLFIIEQFLDDQDQTAITQHNAILQQTLQEHLGTFGFEDFSARQGDRDRRLASLIDAQAQANFPGLTTILFALDKARRSFDIQLAALSEDVTNLGKALATWARLNGIPSLHVLHGVALVRPYTVHNQFVADQLAVYGERSLESFLDAGITPERLRITGNPAWDCYAGLTGADLARSRRRLCERHGLDPEQPIMAYCPTWAPNLTAQTDEHVFGRSLLAFLSAVMALRAAGIPVQAVIKDRPSNQVFAQSRLSDLYQQAGVEPSSVPYVAEPAFDWMLGADVIIGQDSNVLVEALLCGTPVVNLITDHGLRVGPSFDANSGIQEAAAEDLAAVLAALLTSPALRDECRRELLAAAPRYNIGIDGHATERLADLMGGMMKSTETGYVWQECLDVEEIEATGYHGGARGDLVEQFTNSPRILLDIGCAAGGTAMVFKQKYPEARAWGIEVNQSAAKIAATRLDKVLVGKFEDFDLEAEGLAKGSVDAVILADVLEHMYNPWKVMESLRPYLSNKAQVVVSIPNIRNLALMDDLARGYFRYERLGLLDITHIRFFTYRELLRFFHETGYHVVKNTYGIDTRLSQLFNRYKDSCPCDIDTGKLVMKNVTFDELSELCSLQFYMLVEPGQEQLVGYDGPGQFQQAPAEIYSKLLSDHQISRAEAQLYEQRLADVSRRQSVHIAIYAAPEHLSLLSTTIRALADQLYDNVRVTIISPQPAPAEFAGGDRLAWQVAENPGYAALNGMFQDSEADWFAVLNAGDMIVPHSLLLMLEAARIQPAHQLVYCDEDRFQPAEGSLDQPFFKPDFNLAYLRSLPYLGDFYLISRQAFQALGGYRPEFEGMADYDLQLRLFDHFGREAFCHVGDVLYHRSSVRSLNAQPTDVLIAQGERILQEHLGRCGLDAAVRGGSLPGTYRVVPTLDQQHTGVSIILLARNDADQLERAVGQILQRSANANVELIILDCLSDDGKTRRWLDSLDALDEPNLRVYSADTLEGGYYRQANLAAHQARGDFLLFLAADAVPLNDDWLDALLVQASQPGVGAVGGKLINARGEIVSAGRILGLCGHAESPGSGLRFDNPGHFGRLQCTQELSALSIACFMLSRSLFELAGGFDESFAYLFGDVDLCLRLRAAGHTMVWTPEALLLHEDRDFLDLAARPEMERQAAFTADRDVLFSRWLPQLADDPAFNRNLSLNNPESVIEPRSELTKTRLPWRPLPTLLAIPMDDAGCGNYRVIQPFAKAYRENVADGWCRFGTFNPIEVARLAPDTLYVQRHVHVDHQGALANYRRHFPKAKIVFEIDDLVGAVPEKSMYRKNIPSNIGDMLAKSFTFCDRLVVTTQSLKDAYTGLIDDIQVIPNAIDKDIWGGFKPLRNRSRKPRVGWAGGSSHTGDLDILVPVVQALKDEVEWVFFGMLPEGTREMIAEYHGGVHFKDYAAKLAGLDLDLALAPLEDNAFNECKSNLRLLEYGALGYPVIASDLTPYRCGLPVTLVGKTADDWISAIRHAIDDRDSLAKRGDGLRDAIYQDWTLDSFLPQWRSAWFD